MFKHSLVVAENGDMPMNDEAILRGSRNSVRSKASQHVDGCNEMTSYVTAIAQPRIINAWSPSPTKRPSNNRLTNYGSFREVRIDSSPEFRITKGNGKLSAMNGGRDGSERVARALMSPTNRSVAQKALRMDSCSQFEEGGASGLAAMQMSQTISRVNKSPQNGALVTNKMRKLNNARREWE